MNNRETTPCRALPLALAFWLVLGPPALRADDAPRLARLLLDASLHEEALVELEEADPDRKETSLWAEALGMRADVHFFHGRYAVARAGYEELARLRHPLAAAREEALLRAVFETTRDDGEGVLALVALWEKSAAPPGAWAALGRRLERAGEPRAALSAYRRACGWPDLSDDLEFLLEAREAAPASWPRPLHVFTTWNRRGFGKESGADLRATPETLATPHARITHHDPRLAEDLAALVPYERRHILALLGVTGKRPPLDAPVEILLCRDRAAYLEAVGETNAHTSGLAVSKDRFFTHHGAHDLAGSILPHEMGHLLTARLEFVLPRWLSEGLAQRGESGPGRYLSYLTVHAALSSGTVSSLDGLFAEKPDVENEDAFRLFYAQSLALADLLLERKGGPAKLQRLVKDLKQRFIKKARAEVSRRAKDEGVPPSGTVHVDTRFDAEISWKALRDVYGFERPRDLQQAWENWIREVVEGK